MLMANWWICYLQMKIDLIYCYWCLGCRNPVLSSHSKEVQKLVFKTDYPLMQVKRIAEGSILQYFGPPFGLALFNYCPQNLCFVYF